jgi:hypothetical protein
MSDQAPLRARLSAPEVFGDRVHRYRAPIQVLFRALTEKNARWWLGLQPGEVEPEVLEAVPHELVVWSSFWPVSPDDVIRFDLSELTDEREFLRSVAAVEECPTAIRMRSLSDYPPDERGVAITRQRLNRKIGGDLRAVTSACYWGILPPDGGMPPPPEVPKPSWT